MATIINKLLLASAIGVLVWFFTTGIASSEDEDYCNYLGQMSYTIAVNRDAGFEDTEQAAWVVEQRIIGEERMTMWRWIATIYGEVFEDMTPEDIGQSVHEECLSILNEEQRT